MDRFALHDTVISKEVLGAYSTYGTRSAYRTADREGSRRARSSNVEFEKHAVWSKQIRFGPWEATAGFTWLT